MTIFTHILELLPILPHSQKQFYTYTMTMKTSRGVHTDVKFIRQSKRIQSRNTPGKAQVLPAPPQSPNTKTSHPESDDTEHEKQFEAGVHPAPPQSENTKTSHAKLEDMEHNNNIRSRGSPFSTIIDEH